MPYCAVLTCKSKSGSHNLSRGGISYHRFPNDTIRRDEWILATGREQWVPRKASTICSIHFEPNDFVIKDGGRHYLHAVAVPSRNIFHMQENNFANSPEMDFIENQNGATSIEVEIMPQNNITVNPQQTMGKHKTSTVNSARPREHEENKKLVELMQAKIVEQELMIRKLKLRNYRLKKRLFSLKSMEC